ncbi:hypothetical protein ACWDOP_36555 [Nocardia sp. NPDC003693]
MEEMDWVRGVSRVAVLTGLATVECRACGLRGETAAVLAKVAAGS